MYIVGSPGSGKSTLARRVSRITGISCFALDEIQHAPDPSAKMGNRPRDPAERDQIFAEIIKSENWIIEDAGRACFADGMCRADQVVVLDLNRLILYARVVKRYIRQKLGIEKASYRPSLHMLRLMFRWVQGYDPARFRAHSEKLVRLTTGRDVRAFLDRVSPEAQTQK